MYTPEGNRWSDKDTRHISSEIDAEPSEMSAPAHPRELMNGRYVPVDEIADPSDNNPESILIAREENEDRE